MADEQSDDRLITIAGDKYPLPTVDSFDMDEAELLYERCGMTLEDFAVDRDDPDEVAELAKKLRHPGFMRALVHIAYQRGNRSLSKAAVAKVVGKENVLAIFADFVEMEDDAGPPEIPASATSTGPSKPHISSVGSGSGSTNGSAVPDETREGIGTIESDMSPVLGHAV